MNHTIYRAGDRGVSEHGWLSSRFSFSFADWYDPTRMGFGALRVLNDDTIAPASGFGTHPHKDMEIITIVMKGTVTHQDSMGNTGEVVAGEVQVMSAGTGVLHGERNASPTEPLELFQIWILPRERNLSPRYEQKAFSEEATLLVSPDGRDGSLTIMQNAFISRHNISPNASIEYGAHDLEHGLYLFVVTGTVSVLGEQLTVRDAMEVSDMGALAISSDDGAQILMFEVPLI